MTTAALKPLLDTGVGLDLSDEPLPRLSRESEYGLRFQQPAKLGHTLIGQIRAFWLLGVG